MNYPTPHIKATPEDFGKTVLMPGDPLRAKFIAENFLEEAKLVNNVRGIHGYTGYYKDKKISVMASGMGMPSIGIYSYELFNFFDVDNIIRVGSAGGMCEKVKVRDIIIAQGACTDSNYAHTFNLPGTFAPIADYKLLKAAADIAEEMKLSYVVGNVISSDTFYNDNENIPDGMTSADLWRKMGVLGVEMEAAALYMNAARSGKNALAILTVSDHLVTGEALSSDDRQNSFTDMMKLSLETAVKISE
ncbi:MAG: purine-nucleoside phosphorylase [Clostridia bacterium]|nr:purine-nucleoside phosphorylase [Clostridia bacterium]